MLKILKTLYENFDSKLKIEFIYLTFLMILAAIFESLTISLIIPFINILVDGNNNSKIYGDILNYLFSEINLNDLRIISTLIISSIFLGTFLRLKLMWNSIEISNKISSEISSNIYKTMLNQPFIGYINQGSSTVISAMSQKVTIVTNILMSCTTVITSIFILIFILTVLLFNHAFLTIYSVIFYSTAYIFIYYITKKKLKENSKIIADKITHNIKSIQEGFGSLRDILLGNYEKLYIDNYKSSFYKLQKVSGQNHFIGSSPRYLLESFGMILILLAATIIYLNGSDNKNILASLAILTIGAQRMLPLCQQIYISVAGIIGNSSNIIDINNLLYKTNLKDSESSNEIDFNQSIKIDNLSFNYIKSKNVLRNLNLKILKGSKVGVIGATGSGKSTFFDILMGFLEPSNGLITIDGIHLSEKNIKSWKKKIALIPQNIFLISASITKNITFCEYDKKIDHELLQKSIALSDLTSFIKEKEGGLDFDIGERGSKLSGGQKQKIGIARALYSNKEILFMDESTNSLDEFTEKKILYNIFTNQKNLTVFMSTHNHNNLKLCDTIIELKDDKTLIECK
jgi:ABC-type bacteriocin/lantibiotic exporter with double-glycine peptidase domain